MFGLTLTVALTTAPSKSITRVVVVPPAMTPKSKGPTHILNLRIWSATLPWSDATTVPRKRLCARGSNSVSLMWGKALKPVVIDMPLQDRSVTDYRTPRLLQRPINNHVVLDEQTLKTNTTAERKATI